jgi:hypothetical protein
LLLGLLPPAPDAVDNGLQRSVQETFPNGPKKQRKDSRREAIASEQRLRLPRPPHLQIDHPPQQARKRPLKSKHGHDGLREDKPLFPTTGVEHGPQQVRVGVQ